MGLGGLQEAAVRRPVAAAAVPFFGGGAALIWYAGSRFAYATGLAGTPGRLLVQRCVWERAGGKRYPHCGGVFRSLDGRFVDHHAMVGQDLHVGATLAMRRMASGGYEEVSLSASSGWLALTILGLLVLLLGVMMVRAQGRTRPLPRALTAGAGGLGAVALLSALVAGVAGIVTRL